MFRFILVYLKTYVYYEMLLAYTPEPNEDASTDTREII
jgi:hypothetical protein